MPDRLSEAQVDEQLHRIFSDLDELSTRYQAGQLTPPVQPASSLAGDDRLTTPHHLSHAITQLSSVSLDHLHALRTLLVDAGVLHNSAPYTLARSAIEAGATALWILAPRDRRTRVGRRLQLAAQDARDGTRMALGAGLHMPRSLEERLEQIEALKKAATGDDRLPRLETTGIVRWVDDQKISTVGALRAWQVGSGFAHGRLWPSISVLEKEVHRSPVPGVATLRLTNSKDRVLWIAWAAHDLLRATLQLFAQRAAAPY